MNVHELSSRRVVRSPGPSLSRAGTTAIVALVVLGISALAGGVALVAQPDGSIVHVDTRLLNGSPFADYFVPGLVLGGVFGLGSLVIAGLGLRRWQYAPAVAFVIGCGQMIWIVVELVIIRELSFLHPTMFAIGLVIAGAAIPWGRPTFVRWLARPRARDQGTGPTPGEAAKEHQSAP